MTTTADATDVAIPDHLQPLDRLVKAFVTATGAMNGNPRRYIAALADLDEVCKEVSLQADAYVEELMSVERPA